MSDTKARRELIKKIEVKNLALGYERPVSTGLTYTFEPGHTIWLSGHSGLGKSTLLKAIAGLINPLEGEIWINDEPVVDMTFEEFLKFRLSIGYSFDLGGLMNNRTLWDNIMLPLAYHKWLPHHEIEAKVKSLIDLFHLGSFMGERPASVPGGIRKAACLARAFALEPNVLLLDEPIVGLNDEGVAALGTLLGDIKRRGDSVVMVTSRTSEFFSDYLDTELKLTKNGFVESCFGIKKSGGA